jgi:DNA gyrase subunit B
MILDFYRPVVEAGMVHVTLPPLFVVKDGQQRIYCQDESERDAAVARLRANSKRKVEVQRSKGLAEMDADDFWNTVPDLSAQRHSATPK